jgi:hypothetical protein
MNAEFFEADVGDKSINVSSTGFSGAGSAGEKKPLNAARKKATSKWIRIATSSAQKIIRASCSWSRSLSGWAKTMSAVVMKQ